MLTLAILPLRADDWALIAAVLLAALIVLAIYTFKLYQRVPKDDTPLLGQEAVVVAWDGRDRRVEVFGAIWNARLPTGFDAALTKGDIVMVCAAHDLVLTVTPVFGDAA